MNRLFQYTQMQETFSTNMLALVDGQPKVLNLREMLKHYIVFQYQVVRRRVEFDLKKARERAHILEGLAIACDNIDEVIHIIRTSYDDAKDRLMSRFSLSDLQAQAILGHALRAFAGTRAGKDRETSWPFCTLKSPSISKFWPTTTRFTRIIKDDLMAIRQKYGDDRRTEIFGFGKRDRY